MIIYLFLASSSAEWISMCCCQTVFMRAENRSRISLLLRTLFCESAKIGYGVFGHVMYCTGYSYMCLYLYTCVAIKPGDFRRIFAVMKAVQAGVIIHVDVIGFHSDILYVFTESTRSRPPSVSLTERYLRACFLSIIVRLTVARTRCPWNGLR